MNYGQKGREILIDLKRSDWLPPFDEEGIRILLGELTEIHSKIIKVYNANEENNIEGLQSNEVLVSLSYYLQCVKRNHRYIDSYLNHRLNKLRKLRWELGSVLPDRIRQETLSIREKEYFSSYNSLIAEYCENIAIDLTSDIEPPKNLSIEIRVITDCGKLMTENGPISLDKGSTHFLKRTEVEQLIRDGLVEHVIHDDQF